MLLAAIEATNFRNLSGRIEWGPRLNIIYGNNGHGKTNWLEAIYLLARTKSFRTQRLQEAIRFGEELAVVRGKVTTGSISNEIYKSVFTITQRQSSSTPNEKLSQGI
jgi:recombinational DNA repair ATPase RecF